MSTSKDPMLMSISELVEPLDADVRDNITQAFARVELSAVHELILLTPLEIRHINPDGCKHVLSRLRSLGLRPRSPYPYTPLWLLAEPYYAPADSPDLASVEMAFLRHKIFMYKADILINSLRAYAQEGNVVYQLALEALIDSGYPWDE